MSVQPELVDPRDAFLANGPTPLVAAAAPVASASAVLIGAAVVTGILLVRREIRSQQPVTARDVGRIASTAWQKVLPNWMKIAIPAVTQAYSLGATGKLTYDELTLLATDYATELGDYLNQTSADALMEGFTAQVNSGWSGTLAWERTKEAYGLDARQMRSYVSGLMAQDPKAYITEPVSATSRALINQAVSVRAERLGSNEAHKATQVGKNMVWLTMAAHGDIPDGTRKMWRTAEDELVCEVCGPLDGRVIPLHWKFKASTGERFYAPGVHPNCRCTLEIVYPESEWNDIVKNMPGDPFDRDTQGRFSVREERSALDVLHDRKATGKTDPSNPLSILREPKSDAMRYVGTNPAARGGALDVLREGRVQASPMAVLAEAKAAEAPVTEKTSTKKPKAEAKPEAAKESVHLPEGRNATTAFAYGNAALQEAGVEQHNIHVGSVIKFTKVNGYVNDPSLDKAVNEAVAMASMTDEVGDSTLGADLPVIMRFNTWDGDDNAGYENPPWAEKSDAGITGEYVVTSERVFELPKDMLTADGSDPFTKVHLVVLKPLI